MKVTINNQEYYISFPETTNYVERPITTSRSIGCNIRKSNQKDKVFTIANPYAMVEAIDEIDYYKQNADVYLQEYHLIQQKISKLSSTKRRQIVTIVETYLLTK